MTLKHWLWLLMGLVFWAALVALWVTSPHDCEVPDKDGRVTCSHD